MADVFSKIGDSLKSTLKEAVDQTQKSVDQAACRTEILTKKNEVKKLYQALGEELYEVYDAQEEGLIAGKSELFVKIKALKAEIASAEEKLANLISMQKDSFDTFKKDVKSAWEEKDEPKAPLDEADDTVEVMKICELCNTGNHIHAAYCIHCGNKFE